MDRHTNLLECGYSVDERVSTFKKTCEDCGCSNEEILIPYVNSYEELFYCPDCTYEEVYESEHLSLEERNGYSGTFKGIH